MDSAPCETVEQNNPALGIVGDMDQIVKQFVSAYDWVKNPPDPALVDLVLLGEHDVTLEQIQSDFSQLISAMKLINAAETVAQRNGRISSAAAYLAGELRDDVAGGIITIASTDPVTQSVNDVELGPTADAVWRSGALVYLLDHALPPSIKRGGHQVGCVECFCDVAGGFVEVTVRLVRRGECSLEFGVRQSIGAVADVAWVQQFPGAAAAVAAGVSVSHEDVEPARPSEETSDIAVAIATAIAAGEESFDGDPAYVAAALTRHDLASALGEPVSSVEVTFSDSQGAVSIWTPGSELPRVLPIAA